MYIYYVSIKSIWLLDIEPFPRLSVSYIILAKKMSIIILETFVMTTVERGNKMSKLKYLVLEAMPKKKIRYRTTDRFWIIIAVLVLIFIIYAVPSVYWRG